MSRLSEFGAYLAGEGQEVLLPNAYVPDSTRVGDRLRVFVYTDSEDRPVATTRKPHAVVGEFACLSVVDVNRFGAFLDWGLEKDLFVPFREQARPMQKGERHVVRICLDERSRRVIGVSKLQRFLSRSARGLVAGRKVSLLVFGETHLGFSVIIDGVHRGLVYRKQGSPDLEVGSRCDGYVERIRPDHQVDVSLQPVGLQAIVEAKPSILAQLEKAGGFLPFHDKTDAEVIERTFGMSKKSFKKAIGGLYRDRLIVITPEGIQRVKR